MVLKSNAGARERVFEVHVIAPGGNLMQTLYVGANSPEAAEKHVRDSRQSGWLRIVAYELPVEVAL